MTVERLRELYVQGWRFEPKYTRDNEIDELVYRYGSFALHVRSPTDAKAFVFGEVFIGTLDEVLDELEPFVR